MKPNIRTRKRHTQYKSELKPVQAIHPKRKRQPGRAVRIVHKPKPASSSLLRQLQTRQPANPVPPVPVQPAGSNRPPRPPSSPQPSNRQPQRVPRIGLLDAARGDAGRVGKRVAGYAGCFMTLVLLGVMSFAMLFGTFAYFILSNFYSPTRAQEPPALHSCKESLWELLLVRSSSSRAASSPCRSRSFCGC